MAAAELGGCSVAVDAAKLRRQEWPSAFPPQAITKSKAKNPVKATKCFVNEIMFGTFLFSPDGYEPIPGSGINVSLQFLRQLTLRSNRILKMLLYR